MKLSALDSILSRICDLLSSPSPVEVTSPIHRSSVKFRLDSSGNRSRIVSPPVVSSSDDLRFVSTKSLNLQPATPQSAKSSTVSPPLRGNQLPATTATVPSSGNNRHRSAVGRTQRYQSTDTFMITTPDVTAPSDVISSASVSSVASCSRRVDEKCIDEDWQRMVAAASSDQINLVSFHDANSTTSDNAHFSSADAVSYTSSTVPRQSSARRGTHPGTVIFTLQASPPVKGRAVGVALQSIPDTRITTDSSPIPSKPLAFANPLYSHGTKVDASRRGKPAELKSSVSSNNSASCMHHSAKGATGKQAKAVPVASESIGVGKSRRYRDLSGSTESLDSVLATRSVAKHRSTIPPPSLHSFSQFSQSASHIDRQPPPVAPRRPKHGSFQSSPLTTTPNRSIDQRESDFGALKRLWQSIELPTSPSTSSGSARSYQSPARMSRSHITQRQTGTHQHSASFDDGLSDFSSGTSARRGHSCDSLLTGGSALNSHQLKDCSNAPPSIDNNDQSEVLCSA